MSFTTSNGYAYLHRDNEPSPQPRCIDPRLLQLQHKDVVGRNEQVCPPLSSMGAFVRPEETPSLVERPADVQQHPSLQYPPPPLLSESFYIYSNCPPYLASPRQVHEGMSVGGDPYISDSSPPQSHLPTDAIQATDPSWTVPVVVDGPLSQSPTHLPQALPLEDIVQIVEAEHGYQTAYQLPSPSSTSPITVQMFFEGTPTSNVTMAAPQPTAGSDLPVETVTVLRQRPYKPRQSSLNKDTELPSISFEPHGYPVSSALQGKTHTLMALPNYDRVAFENFTVGQKLSWRFLFDGLPDFQQQLNVLGNRRVQPTVQRIVVETAKALVYFKEKEPRFAHPLARLVILEIVLVSSASVQAKIGLLGVREAGAPGLPNCSPEGMESMAHAEPRRRFK